MEFSGDLRRSRAEGELRQGVRDVITRSINSDTPSGAGNRIEAVRRLAFNRSGEGSHRSSTRAAMPAAGSTSDRSTSRNSRATNFCLGTEVPRRSAGFVRTYVRTGYVISSTRAQCEQLKKNRLTRPSPRDN